MTAEGEDDGQLWGEGPQAIPLEFLEGTDPADSLTSGFWLLGYEAADFYRGSQFFTAVAEASYRRKD